MKQILKIIWNSGFLSYLTMVFLLGISLAIIRPSVKDSSDLIEINGTLKSVNQELVYFTKIKKTENDSTYHIRLNEYPSYFQVSYKNWNGKAFYKNSKYGDLITFHIAKVDKSKLNQKDQRIRTFSIKVNDKEYLSPESGLKGFGKGYFEYSMILVPLLLLFTIVSYRIRKEKTVAK